MTMKLTPEREQELIEQNTKKIYRAIDNFTMRSSNPRYKIDYDDLFQEVALAFIQYVRKCDTEEQINNFPWHDAKHAMCVEVMKAQPFSVPHGSTKEFSRILKQIPATISLDLYVEDCEDNYRLSDTNWVDDKNFSIDWDNFMSSYDESTNRIASMRRCRMTYRQVGAQFGVSDKTIYKRINRLKDDYHNYAEEDDWSD